MHPGADHMLKLEKAQSVKSSRYCSIETRDPYIIELVDYKFIRMGGV
jgi:hypothetical protein